MVTLFSLTKLSRSQMAFFAVASRPRDLDNRTRALLSLLDPQVRNLFSESGPDLLTKTPLCRVGTMLVQSLYFSFTSYIQRFDLFQCSRETPLSCPPSPEPVSSCCCNLQPAGQDRCCSSQQAGRRRVHSHRRVTLCWPQLQHSNAQTKTISATAYKLRICLTMVYALQYNGNLYCAVASRYT